ncbi:chloramphenicol phosphotransferase [Veronia nyctiphanis]|uniref:Chloramphenicol phosphotransferase n=1 Tax=Veronia nyctiphanis TaxID=1278244 RepID=A0A4Q0YN43_9GAMM|nr:AAA family ATPase [Veronia nyctiphanis]RXJ72226.1 chloramphenicol phosphotransferase [Veronia nyctiphanis]
MYPDIILLNGTGSSGKTSLAKALQERLPVQYLNFSIDNILYALPPSDLQRMIAGESIDREGYDYGQLTTAYHRSIDAILRSGCKLIIDNAWVNKDELDTLEELLSGYDIVRVKVKCNLDVCIARELARGDRSIGLAEWEYPLVHKHMRYDVEVDTSKITPDDAAMYLLDKLTLHPV